MPRRPVRFSSERFSGLARGYPLDDPARPSVTRSERFPDLGESRFQYDPLIRTGLGASGTLRVSRQPPPVLGGSRYSPQVAVRATGRSRVDRSFRTVLYSKQLLPRALACAKRAIRKEVLFALNRRGKGSGATRRFRRVDSSFRC